MKGSQAEKHFSFVSVFVLCFLSASTSGELHLTWAYLLIDFTDVSFFIKIFCLFTRSSIMSGFA